MNQGEDLLSLIQRARRVPITPAQVEGARRRFGYGNLALENPRITRELDGT